MGLFVAFDSGGSKTDAVLFDETGHILRRCLGRGCNGMNIGVEAANARMLQILQALLRDSSEPVLGAYGAVAGTMYLGDGMERYLNAHMSLGHLHIEGDGFCILAGELGPGSSGCSMVCGTGSSLFVIEKGKFVTKIGGKGYLVDTGGSGFGIGQDAICTAMRACDHRCKDTVLVELLSKAMGKPVMDTMLDIYNIKTGGRPYIASFAHTVFEGRCMGDWACEEIFQRHALLLADLIQTAKHYFSGSFPVVVNGGLIRAFPEYLEAVRAYSPSEAQIILGNLPPIYGAAVSAAYEVGVTVSNGFRETFQRDYSGIIPVQV